MATPDSRNKFTLFFEYHFQWLKWKAAEISDWFAIGELDDEQRLDLYECTVYSDGTFHSYKLPDVTLSAAPDL